MALAAMASAAPYYDPYATPSPIYYKPMPNDFWYSDQYLNYLSRAERDGDAPTTPSPAAYEAPVTEPATTPAPVEVYEAPATTEAAAPATEAPAPETTAAPAVYEAPATTEAVAPATEAPEPETTAAPEVYEAPATEAPAPATEAPAPATEAPAPETTAAPAPAPTYAPQPEAPAAPVAKVAEPEAPVQEAAAPAPVEEPEQPVLVAERREEPGEKSSIKQKSIRCKIQLPVIRFFNISRKRVGAWFQDRIITIALYATVIQAPV